MLKVTDTTADSFVQVFMDDILLESCKTPVARGKQEPVWRYQCSLEVVAPRSMVRVQVFDDQPTSKVQIGFVEFCIGDIPYDTPIEGWFELRFQDNMKKTSVQRYADHSKTREETRSKQVEKEQAEKAEKDKKLEEAKLRTEQQVLPEGDGPKVKTKKEIFQGSKQRAVDAFQSCVHSTADKAHELGFETLSSTLGGQFRSSARDNSGEVYLTLKLTRVASSLDSVFALALNPPAPVNSGTQYETEWHDAVDVQHCWDELYQIKVRLWEDAALCMMYWFRYIFSWRSSILSFIYLLGCLVIAWHSYTMWAISPLMLILALTVNYFESARKFMTRGGSNASFDEEGFAHAAAWRSTDEMMTYVRRLVHEDLKGVIVEKEKQKFRNFAASCMRDGKPEVSLEDLRVVLRSASFVSMENAGEAQAFSRGDLVLIDGHDRAKILELGPERDEVTVAYDVKSSREPTVVRKRRVTRRSIEGNLDEFFKDNLGGTPVYMLRTFPSGAAKLARDIYPTIEEIKFATCPAVEALTNVVIWKKFGSTLGLVIALLLISAAFSWAAIMFLLEQVSESGAVGGVASIGDEDVSPVQEAIVFGLRHIDNAVAILITLVLLITQSWWFSSIGSMFRILSRCGHRRTAPRGWAFYVPDAEHKKALDNLNAQEQKEYSGRGMFHLPYMTTDSGTSYAYASQSPQV
eukprot:TRINITY_DN37990_c0_g1_i1.p1 TRINITY_DN37990_c0_g1~~TRINITY_DN37990_c0_g1_i1.p1  ORF type:complete len:798 (-),score=158.48 TRINITY_DN37990_c0_g1_i1:72-2141(-)